MTLRDIFFFFFFLSFIFIFLGEVGAEFGMSSLSLLRGFCVFSYFAHGTLYLACCVYCFSIFSAYSSYYYGYCVLVGLTCFGRNNPSTERGIKRSYPTGVSNRATKHASLKGSKQRVLNSREWYIALSFFNLFSFFYIRLWDICHFFCCWGNRNNQELHYWWVGHVSIKARCLGERWDDCLFNLVLCTKIIPPTLTFLISLYSQLQLPSTCAHSSPEILP